MNKADKVAFADKVLLVGVLLILTFIVQLTPIQNPLTYLTIGFPILWVGVFYFSLLGFPLVIAAWLYKLKVEDEPSSNLQEQSS